MPLSLRERKILWARSGNLCAFPGCSQELVQPGYGDGGDVVVGEEAHIVARSPDGPRGAASPYSYGDSYGNLILLCPTHHQIVDAQPSMYTPDVLRAFKAAHEMRVRARLLSSGQLDALGAAGYRFACGGLRAVNAWRFGSAVVVACSFGSDPVPGPGGRWRGAGLEFKHVHDSQGSETLFTSSEADPDIEYWASTSTLHVVEYTYEPEANTLLPFVEHRFVPGPFPAARSTHVLLQVPLAAGDNLAEIARALRDLPLGGKADIVEVLLYRLRNAGLRDPDAAIEELQHLRSQWWYDGANAEAATAIGRELTLVKTARARGLTTR